MRKLYAAISLLFVILSILLYDINIKATREFQEDRLVENISAALFFITFLFSFLFLIAHEIVRYKKTLILVMSLGLAGFLDELSFGERIFNLNMPVVLGVPFDALHDVVDIVIVASTNYQYLFWVLFLLICIVAVYIAIYKRAALSGVFNSILLEVPYSFLAFFVVFVSIAILLEQTHWILNKPPVLHALEEILEMNAALALLFCCLSIRCTRNWLLVGSALIASTALGTVYGPDHDATWKVYGRAGRYAYNNAEFTEAADQYESALKEAEGFVPQDRRLAMSLNNLAEVYHAQGRFAETESLRKRALAIVEKALGPEHPDVAQSLNNLATLYQAQGRFAEAEPLYWRALAIKEKVLGIDHPSVATGLNNLALAYHAQGKFAEAGLLHKRALAIREKVLGLDHPDVSTSLNNLAALYQAQGKHAEAGPLYVRALAIREKALGPEHPDVAQSLNNLATLYQAQGKFADAEPLFKRGLAIFEKALGSDHPDVATSLENYAILLRETGRGAEGAKMEARAKAIRAKHAKEKP